MDDGLIRQLLVAIQENEKKAGELSTNLIVLTAEMKNMTHRINEETKTLRRDTERNNMDINQNIIAMNTLDKRVTYLEYVGSNDKSLLRTAMNWLQWFVIVGIALIQLIKGL